MGWKKVGGNGASDEYSPTGSFGENALAGIGRSMVHTGRGIGQALGMVSDEDIAEANRLDQPLMETAGGQVGNVLGSMAQMPLPITSIPRAMAAGAAFSGLQPGSPDERAQEAVTGGLMGAGGQLIGDVIGRAVHPVRGQQPAAGLLASEGVPLSAADQTGSRALHAFEGTVGQMPGAAGRHQSFREGQQAAFNRAALSRAGVDADVASEQVIDQAYNTFSTQYKRLIGDTPIDMGDDWLESIVQIDELHKQLPPSLRSTKVGSLLDDMLDMGSSNATGRELQQTRSALSEMERTLKQSGKKPALRRTLNRVIQSMDDTVENSLPSKQADELRALRRNYANLKQIEPVIDEFGNISPARLNNKLKTRDKTGYARGTGDLTALAKAGKQVLPEKLPQSGTAERQLIQGMVGGGAGGAAGMLTGDPMMAMQGLMAGVAAPAAGANAAYRAYQSPAGQRYLTEGVPMLANTLDSNLMRVLTSTATIGAGSTYNDDANN